MTTSSIAAKRRPWARSRRALFLRRFVRNRLAVVGVFGLLALAVLGVLGPHLLYWHYEDIDPNSFLAPPSSAHPLGTTQAGRDVLALTVRGLGRSLQIGLLVALLSTSMAAIIGASAAYLGGWFEKAMLWLIDLLLVVPSFFLIAIVTRSAGSQSSWLLVFLLAGFAWPLSARVVRSITLSVKEREYVLAARFAGVSAPRIIAVHLLPNAASMLIIDATLGVGYAILAEAGLSYFGFGVQAPDTSLGTLLGEGARMVTTYWWVFTGPAVALVGLVLCVNAIGDGLRDAMDAGSVAGGRL